MKRKALDKDIGLKYKNLKAKLKKKFFLHNNMIFYGQKYHIKNFMLDLTFNLFVYHPASLRRKMILKANKYMHSPKNPFTGWL